jgi:hypothetical protein
VQDIQYNAAACPKVDRGLWPLRGGIFWRLFHRAGAILPVCTNIPSQTNDFTWLFSNGKRLHETKKNGTPEGVPFSR